MNRKSILENNREQEEDPSKVFKVDLTNKHIQ